MQIATNIGKSLFDGYRAPYVSVIPHKVMDMLLAIQNVVYTKAKDTGNKELETIALTPKIDDDIKDFYEMWQRDRSTQAW